MTIIVVDDSVWRDATASLLVGAGWAVESAPSGNAALDLLVHVPCATLFLLNPEMHGTSGVEIVAAIRASTFPAAAAPIVAYTARVPTDPEHLYASGFDDILVRSSRPEDLLSTVTAWQPDGSDDSLGRLEASFGAEQIGSMVSRFGELLSDALAALREGSAQPIAHRVAGVAGILGFSAVGKAWLAISEGDGSARGEARRESRRALAAIARR